MFELSNFVVQQDFEIELQSEENSNLAQKLIIHLKDLAKNLIKGRHRVMK